MKTIEYLNVARTLIEKALELHENAANLDPVAIEIIRATDSIDRARRKLAQPTVEHDEAA